MLKKFYVTGGRETVEGKPRDDNAVPALVCYGRDRIDALANSGITVWEEADYLRAMAAIQATT